MSSARRRQHSCASPQEDAGEDGPSAPPSELFSRSRGLWCGAWTGEAAGVTVDLLITVDSALSHSFVLSPDGGNRQRVSSLQRGSSIRPDAARNTERRLSTASSLQ